MYTSTVPASPTAVQVPPVALQQTGASKSPVHDYVRANPGVTPVNLAQQFGLPIVAAQGVINEVRGGATAAPTAVSSPNVPPANVQRPASPITAAYSTMLAANQGAIDSGNPPNVPGVGLRPNEFIPSKPDAAAGLSIPPIDVQATPPNTAVPPVANIPPAAVQAGLSAVPANTPAPLGVRVPPINLQQTMTGREGGLSVPSIVANMPNVPPPGLTAAGPPKLGVETGTIPTLQQALTGRDGGGLEARIAAMNPAYRPVSVPGNIPPAEVQAAAAAEKPGGRNTRSWLQELGRIAPLIALAAAGRGNPGAAAALLQGWQGGKAADTARKREDEEIKRKQDQQTFENTLKTNELDETTNYHKGLIETQKAKAEAALSKDQMSALEKAPDGAAALALYDSIDPDNKQGLRDSFLGTDGQPKQFNPFSKDGARIAMQSQHYDDIRQHYGDQALANFEREIAQYSSNPEAQHQIALRYDEEHRTTKFTDSLQGGTGATDRERIAALRAEDYHQQVSAHIREIEASVGLKHAQGKYLDAKTGEVVPDAVAHRALWKATADFLSTRGSEVVPLAEAHIAYEDALGDAATENAATRTSSSRDIGGYSSPKEVQSEIDRLTQEMIALETPDAKFAQPPGSPVLKEHPNWKANQPLSPMGVHPDLAKKHEEDKARLIRLHEILAEFDSAPLTAPNKQTARSRAWKDKQNNPQSDGTVLPMPVTPPGSAVPKGTRAPKAPPLTWQSVNLGNGFKMRRVK